MRIALFVTCLVDAVFPAAGQATVRLLERLGHEVTFTPEQTCCGQMHTNTGYLREALPLVRRYVEVFEGSEVIVVPSGSCTGSVRHQHAMVARRFGDEKLAKRAEAVAARTFELSELLVDVLGVEDVGAAGAGAMASTGTGVAATLTCVSVAAGACEPDNAIAAATPPGPPTMVPASAAAVIAG